MGNNLQNEIEEIASWRRWERTLLIAAFISLILLATYLLKFVLKGQPPEWVEDSMPLSLLWYYSPTPASAGAPLSPAGIYCLAPVGVIFFYIGVFKHRQKKSRRFDLIRQQVRDERLKIDLRRIK